MIQEAEEQVRIICENLKTAQSHQKSQYDCRHKEVNYEVDEKAYLWVSPLNFGKVSIMPWEPISPLAPIITLSQVVK